MLYEHSEKRLVDRLKMEAAFHGIKIDVPKKTSPVNSGHGKCVSGDPDSYNHLSDEERKELTRKMMERHKFWDSNDVPLGGKKAVDKR